MSQNPTSFSPAKPRRKRLRDVLILCGLLMVPTAVLAYADLLPDSLDLLGIDLSESPDLPHVARQIAIGAPLKIVAFGSSSTEGIGASSPANSYPSRLQVDPAQEAARHGCLGDQPGIGGEHVDDMLKRLDRDVIAAEPQLVIWQTGSNDPLRGVSLDHFRDATAAAIRRIREGRHRRGADGAAMVPEARFDARLLAVPGRRALDRG